MEIAEVVGLVIVLGLYALVVLKYSAMQRKHMEELYNKCLRDINDRNDEDRYND